MNTTCPYCSEENFEAQESDYEDGEVIIIECGDCQMDYRVTVTLEATFQVSKMEDDDDE